MNKTIVLCLLLCWNAVMVRGQQHLAGASKEGQALYQSLVKQDASYIQKQAALNKRLLAYQAAKNRPLIKQTKASIQQLAADRSEKLYAKIIRENRDSALTVYAMSIYGMINVIEHPLKTESLLNTLSTPMQHSEQFDKLRQIIELSKALMIGQPAPLFSQADTSGNQLSLTALRGRYVLIDFWASWCKPCRAQNPMLLKVFEKYKDKGFTILGVSLDGNKEAWTEAIRQDKLSWYHVSDLKSWGNAAAARYNISSVPQNYLLNPDGIIIGRNLDEDELEEILDALPLSNFR